MEESGNRIGHITQGINNLQEHERITGFWEISRRSLVNNSFDGILTMIGIVMGQYLAGVKAPGTIVITGVAAAISLSISGWSSAYLAESAERQPHSRIGSAVRRVIPLWNSRPSFFTQRRRHHYSGRGFFGGGVCRILVFQANLIDKAI